MELLRRFRLELDAVRRAVRDYPKQLVSDEELVERIRQLFLAWESKVKPSLLVFPLPLAPAKIRRLDAAFHDIARLTSRRSRRAHYLRLLARARRIFAGEVLLAVARVQLPGAPKAEERPETAQPIAKLFPRIPDLSNDLIPNSIVGWADRVRTFLQKNPFERNVFIMVAYRPGLRRLIDRVSQALRQQGLTPVVAREHGLTDDLYNPIACLMCCRYGVAIFAADQKKQTHNPNVAYELGMMQLLKRPCLILKHTSLKALPADFLQKLYENYSSPDQAVQLVTAWAAKLVSEE